MHLKRAPIKKNWYHSFSDNIILFWEKLTGCLNDIDLKNIFKNLLWGKIINIFENFLCFSWKLYQKFSKMIN